MPKHNQNTKNAFSEGEQRRLSLETHRTCQKKADEFAQILVQVLKVQYGSSETEKEANAASKV